MTSSSSGVSNSIVSPSIFVVWPLKHKKENIKIKFRHGICRKLKLLNQIPPKKKQNKNYLPFKYLRIPIQINIKTKTTGQVSRLMQPQKLKDQNWLLFLRKIQTSKPGGFLLQRCPFCFIVRHDG